MRRLALLCLILLSCACSKPDTAATEGNFRSVPNGDPAMAKAIKEARGSFGEFKRRLVERKPGEFFLVKIRIDTPDDSSEHIWVDEVELRNGLIEGKLANDPVNFKGKFGDPIEVSESRLSDWAIFDKDDNVIAGGYTIKLLKQE